MKGRGGKKDGWSGGGGSVEGHYQRHELRKVEKRKGGGGVYFKDK